MKLILSLIFSAFVGTSLLGQVTSDYCIQVTASYQTGPDAITLHWKAYSNSQGITIHRKPKDSMGWSKTIATLSGTANSWVDYNVKEGETWEYKIVSDNSSFYSYGYILAGINAPAIENKGRMILMLEDTLIAPLSNEINQLIYDLRGDGWVVLKHVVKRSDNISVVKNLIKADYNADPINTKALFLVGHIPVPYSGDFAPDGHPNHYGAWPADNYYGDIDDSLWVDKTVVDTVSFDLRNWNRIGDGKFDNDLIPSALELQVGRVDFNDMPTFKESEINLVKRYLNKDHYFKVKNLVPNSRAIMDDKFGAFSGEAFAASGYRAFAPMVGDTLIDVGNYLDLGAKKSYLLGYACSGGYPQGFISYFGSDTFVNDSVPVVFNMFFGSYFGDWEFTNDFLRAPLASKGWQLTNCWSGRPYWIMHQMALGENIGYCARLSGYDRTLYYRHPRSDFGALRNIALMGDPSLRLHVVAMPGALTLKNVSDSIKAKSVITLNWGASPQTNVLGYNVYRARSLDSPFVRINTDPIANTTYTDSTAKHGTNYYMVRAMALEICPSGSYFNLSLGQISAPTYSFTGIDPITQSQKINFQLYPNPSTGNFTIQLNDEMLDPTEISISDIYGKTVYHALNTHSKTIHVSLNSLSKGIYLVQLKNNNGIGIQKVTIN